MAIEPEELATELAARFAETETAPLLFVGSGLARRYLNLPDWEGLLEELADLTEHPFRYFYSRADGDLAKTASLMAEEFHEIWWDAAEYEAERDEYEELITSIASPLKLEAARYVEERTSRERIPEEYAEEVELFREAKVDGIITTNWDSLLELLFPDFTVYVGQREAIFSQSYSIAEIFKIHGCSSRPNSLVLTEQDYEKFNRDNPYLAAKLLTMFLEHPVVFLGYSLNDENIQTILEDVLQCLDEERQEILQNRLLFVQYKEEPGLPDMGTSTINLASRDLRLTTVTAHDFSPVYRALGEAERKLSAKLLRQIKERLYEIVRGADPDDQLAVVDIEDLDEHEDVEFVVGVGIHEHMAEKGLRGVVTDDLIRDVVFDEGRFDADAGRVVEVALPRLLRGNRTHVPVYRYLDAAGLLDEQRRPELEQIPASVGEAAQLDRETFESSAYARAADRVVGMSVEDIREEYGEDGMWPYLTFIEHDAEELQELLRDNYAVYTNGDQSRKQWYKKLVCVYDRIRHGPGFPVEPA